VRDRSSWDRFLHVARTVLLSPFSLAIWAGGVLSYALLGRWALLGALALEAALLFWRLRDERYLRSVFHRLSEREEQAAARHLEGALEHMDFETRQRIRYILQLQKEILKEARAEDVAEYARRDLERIASGLGPLVERAVRLGSRKQHLTRYLNHVDERALKSYCTNLRQRIESAEDPVARTQYEQALRAREAELQAYQAIATAACRIDSQLENVEATFASWKARMIRIKTADVASLPTVSEGLCQELQHLTSDIDVLDASVSQALASDSELILRQQA